MDSKGLARSGVGFGTALAIAISWSLHQSVLLQATVVEGGVILTKTA